MPDRSDNYQLLSWPKTKIDREIWNSVLGDIAARLTAREELEASFEALIEQGTQASLDYVQATIAPQLENLQDEIEEARAQIEEIIGSGTAPNSAKLGGQLPAYYAPVAYVDGWAADVATALGLKADQLTTYTKLEVNNLVGSRLALSGGTMSGDINLAGNKLAGVASINGGPMSGARNKIINGGFSICQRLAAPATGQVINAGSSVYVLDRWLITNNTNQPVTISQQLQTIGQVLSPGNPKFKLRAAFATAPTSGTLRIAQRIEGVETLAAAVASARGHFTGPAGNETLACELVQNFGTGGAPSGAVTTASASLDVTTIYSAASQVRRALFNVPSVAAKTLGSNGNDYLELAWVLTPRQTGNYELSVMSFVEGDSRAEADPFGQRPLQQEIAICQRYYYRNNAMHFTTYQIGGSATGMYYTFPVRMRAVPTFGAIGIITSVNASGYSPSVLTQLGAEIRTSAVASGPVVVGADNSFDAEL
ncbi:MULTISPECIES: hypothetical protein [unclassified Rhizobium]|uniref:hypothetical protein n=1 Tax=unclassified Rhizobium TaxID=2613769 RepID=UPI001ADC80C5|nr:MULTISPECIES: hypothetical protein [unclassified Rhizobium]MBO9125453.1 hypothetical protein [Rhizobium sp. 16-488-2b]MBO9176038.1 hypothetical protein [Rhizobium sp. 16-488-2a]